MNDDDIVKKFSDLINNSTPKIARTGTGLDISLAGQTYAIAFSVDSKTISKTVITKR